MITGTEASLFGLRFFALYNFTATLFLNAFKNADRAVAFVFHHCWNQRCCEGERQILQPSS
jgi:hypothetical protein